MIDENSRAKLQNVLVFTWAEIRGVPMCYVAREIMERGIHTWERDNRDVIEDMRQEKETQKV